MDDNQLNELKDLLEKRRQDLMDIIVDNEKILMQQISPDESEDSRVDFNHPADMLTGDPDYEKELKLVRRSRAELAMVEQALSRIDKEDYGVCDNCGKEIGFQRMRAVPFAVRCVECQEKYEADEADLYRSARSPGSDTNIPPILDEREADASPY